MSIFFLFIVLFYFALLRCFFFLHWVASRHLLVTLCISLDIFARAFTGARGFKNAVHGRTTYTLHASHD